MSPLGFRVSSGSFTPVAAREPDAYPGKSIRGSPCRNPVGIVPVAHEVAIWSWSVVGWVRGGKSE